MTLFPAGRPERREAEPVRRHAIHARGGLAEAFEARPRPQPSSQRRLGPQGVKNAEPFTRRGPSGRWGDDE